MLRWLTDQRRRDLSHWLLELVVVIAGVLIALFAQQWAEDRASHRRGQAAEARIRDEVKTNLFIAAERLTLQNCVRARISEISRGLADGRTDWQALDGSAAGAEPMALPRMYRVPSRPWIDDAHRSALASGDLTSIAPERRASIAFLYTQIPKLAEYNAAEGQLATELAPLQFDPILNPAERNAHQAVLARLDWLNGLTVIMAKQLFQAANELGYRLTDQDIRAFGWQEGIDLSARIYGAQCVDRGAIGRAIKEHR